jgi:hypothetical protein
MSANPYLSGDDGPARDFAAVTPDDATDLPCPARRLYIGVSGDVALVSVFGVTATFKAVPVGVLDVICARVKLTGTTATNIVALF